jgi:trimeric autotransporter adhesin
VFLASNQSKPIIMKAFGTSAFFLLICSGLMAQFQLDVDGNARIDGRLDLKSDGISSIFIGSGAGLNDDGSNNKNVFIGGLSGFQTTSGYENTFLGHNAGVLNTSGYENTFLGQFAGYSNTTASKNTFIGNNAGVNTTEYSLNTFVGQNAGYANVTGYANTFLGQEAGSHNTDGELNTFVGQSAGEDNTTGFQNTFVGQAAGHKNTTGYFNTFLGRFTGFNNESGYYNTFAGHSAGEDNTTGHGNSFVGESSGNRNTSGIFNTFVGRTAGLNNTIGDLRTGVGNSSNSIGTNYDNSTGIGYNADPTGSNVIHIGNTSVISIKGEVGFSTYSDARFKKNIQRNEVPGLAFIRELDPVTYHMDIRAQADWKEAAYGEPDTITWNSKYDIGRITFSGFLAQEVEAAAQKIGYDFSGVDKPQNDKGVYGLRYATFVVPLVKATQEQDEEIRDLRSAISDQKLENERLRDRLNDLEGLVQQLLDDEEESTITLEATPELGQNEPNPFTESTRITYFLPEGIKQAELLITAANGQIVKQVRLENRGEGVLNIKAGSLPAGTYQYSLRLDGQVRATRRLVLTR